MDRSPPSSSSSSPSRRHHRHRSAQPQAPGSISFGEYLLFFLILAPFFPWIINNLPWSSLFSFLASGTVTQPPSTTTTNPNVIATVIIQGAFASQKTATLSDSPVTTITPVPVNTMSSWTQRTIHLDQQSRGAYLITNKIERELPEIKNYSVGMLNLLIQHTSCALSLNENFDPDVRVDMNTALNRIAPEDPKGTLYRHADEGLDDMPAHIKSSLVGTSLNVPIQNGRLGTGTWQGIWYLEFRASKHSRRVLATIQGVPKN